MDHTFVDFAEIFAEIICIICSIRIWTWCLMCGNSSWRTARTDLDLWYCNRYVLHSFLPNWVVPICYKDIDHNPSLLYEGYGSSCRSRFHVRRAIVHLGKNSRIVPRGRRQLHGVQEDRGQQQMWRFELKMICSVNWYFHFGDLAQWNLKAESCWIYSSGFPQ